MNHFLNGSLNHLVMWFEKWSLNHLVMWFEKWSLNHLVMRFEKWTMSVTGGDTTEINITGLMSSTTYSIEVAAVNIINTGEYSDPLSVITEGKHIFISSRN